MNAAAEIVHDPADLEHLQNGNRFMGSLPSLHNTLIHFYGKNNILYCEEGVVIEDSDIKFKGDNALVYLGRNRHKYLLSLTMNHNNVFHMGRDNYINGDIHVVLSEEKHFFAGDDGLYSFGVWARNADPHLIYSCETGQRINPTKSIYIGDHVWIGQSVFLLKGTQIDSGSIIGAMAVVSGKKIGHNSSWAGNPVRKVSDSVFWDGVCVHLWKEAETEKSRRYEDYIAGSSQSADAYIYRYDPSQVISFDELDRMFDGGRPLEKLEYLQSLAAENRKNRFVHLTTDDHIPGAD